MQSGCLIIAGLLIVFGIVYAQASDLLVFEAESGTLGANFTNGVSGTVQFISISTDTVNSGNPGNASRVATYSISFPEAGTYQLYARIRVGPDGYNDDSLFYAASFGSKSPTTDSDWVFVNGLAGVGFSNLTDVVTGSGTLGNGMWKWINLSQFTSQSGFVVSTGNLTQTFQIGARENGLDLDKFAFGTLGTAFTVSNLDTGTLPAGLNINTNLFVGPDGGTLHRFSATINGLNLDGANPAAGLVLSGGVLVGTTLNGGALGAGTLFTLSLDGTNFNIFRTFTNTPDAGIPQGELSLAGNVFFSTTWGGGVSGVGTVIGPTNGGISVLRSFSAVNADNATNSSGASPLASLASSGSTLFGAAPAGGTAANGVVFAAATNGTSLNVLHHFTALDSAAGTNADGALPQGGVILSGSLLYGTASAGGAGGAGVIFSLATNGANFTTLHSFSGMDPRSGTNADGALPSCGLILSSNRLYGTTFAGGLGGCGVIFSIQTNGNDFTVLHHFAATDMATGTNAGGASPVAGLILSSNVLYGTAAAGGTGAAGAVFSYDLNNGRFAAIKNFSPLTANGTNADGAFPVAPLMRLGNTLYGTAFGGGPGAAGAVFAVPIPAPPAVITNITLNPNGTVTLHFLGGANTTNVVQSTAALTPPVNWQNVSTNAADAQGVWQFTDANQATTRFYRSYAQ